MLPLLLVWFIAAVALSVILVKLLIIYSNKHALIDIPNERSSHTSPTPSGGGLAISLLILGMLVFQAFTSYFPSDIHIYLCVAVLIVTIIGWLDDHYDLSPRIRFIFYSVAAVLVIIATGGLSSLSFGIFELPLATLPGWVLTYLGIVWLTNLYNFMDGTDGLAAIQAISASLLGGSLLYLEQQVGLALVCFTILAASTGFLFWNYPPAKIFMGDVGSCVLGFVFAALALLSDANSNISIVIWCMLLSFFICDATFTLVQRIIRKESWYKAHRDHAYQCLIKLGYSHRKLALLSLALHLLLVWPLVLVAYSFPAVNIIAACSLIAIMFIIWWCIQKHYKNNDESMNSL